MNEIIAKRIAFLKWTIEHYAELIELSKQEIIALEETQK